MSQNVFHPKIFSTLKNYSRDLFFKDLIAGIIVGIVAIPLAIAFGIASGATPQQGLITAIIAGFLISLFGGSRVLIGGPTGAFIVIIYEIIQKYGYEGLIGSTIIAGILLVLMGIFRIGSWIRFIPAPVLVGFTSGIGVIIFSSQIKDLLGLYIDSVPPDFISKWYVYISNLGTYSAPAILISALTILIFTLLPRFLPRVPSAFIALIVTTLLCSFFPLSLETIGTKFGEVSVSFPEYKFSLDLAHAKDWLYPGISIALLAAIESLMCALVADGMIGGKHRSNTELIGQGIANFFSACFGGLPATGALARTATGIRVGARTPVAGIVHSLFLLVTVLFLSSLISLIPMATLAGILVVVAYKMSEWREWRHFIHVPRSDLAILLITFLLTVFFDLILAIQVGVLLSVFLFMKKMSDASTIKKLNINEQEIETYEERRGSLYHFSIPENVEVFEISGAFFFGAAIKFSDVLFQSYDKKTYLILRMNQVYLLDGSGIKVLERFISEVKKHGTKVFVAELNRNCLDVFVKSKLLKMIGEEHLFKTLQKAIEFTKG